MLNVDRYRDELLKEMKFRKERLNDCENDSYRGVEIYFNSIKEVKKRHGGGSSVLYGDVVEWLFSEYEPPLLKDGNGLKPSDWIMVRDNDDSEWENRQFLAYFDGWFYARIVVPDGWVEKIDRFRHARLPEDNE